MPADGPALKRRLIFATVIAVALTVTIFVFLIPDSAEAEKDVTAFTSPDCSFKAISGALDDASTRIYVAMYDLTSLPLLYKMASAAENGVEVRILLEWDVIGEDNDGKKEKLELCYYLDESGVEVRFLEETEYTLFHAKYAILDSETILITADNWVENGVPQDPSYGNRGWGISIRNSSLAELMEDCFLAEWATGTGDWRDQIRWDGADLDFPMISVEGGYDPFFTPMTYDLESKPEVFVSPFLDGNPIIDQIALANHSVYVEQQIIKLEWGGEESPYIEALKEAAERGCEVRVLLDGSPYNGMENQKVVNHLNDWACEIYDLQAKLFDQGPLRMLHNKGMVVDGNTVIISSMNWNTACNINRDISLVLEGEVADYFERAFLHDWDLKWDYHIKIDMTHDNRGIYSMERVRRELWTNSIHCKVVPVLELDSPVFVISDPREALSEWEVELLEEFVEGGGKVVMTSFNKSDSGYRDLNLVLKELGSSMSFSDNAFYGYIYTWLNEEKISMLRPRAIDPGNGTILCEWSYGVLGAYEDDIYLFGSSFFVDLQNLERVLKFFNSLL